MARKTKTDKPKHAFSLTFAFSGLILITFLVIAALVSIIIVVLVYEGTLKLGDIEFHVGAFMLQMLFWSLIFGSALSILTARFLMKPVTKIQNALHALASGDFSVRLHFKGPFSRTSVFRELTDSFNKMASELEHTEMLRSDFINNFSHEFKTPIVSIAGFAKLLKHSRLSTAEQMEYLDIIEEESLRLSHMATNVLELTRVENQNILTDIKRFNLSEQLRTCVLMLEGKWSRKHIDLSLPMEEYYVKGSEDLLKLVWINLFDNAIKFSQEYGLISAEITANAGNLEVSICNYGETIPPDKIEKIFRKFYQADESHAPEGNGVGLAVVKKVIELHQGTISVLSRDGKTTFTVTLQNAETEKEHK